MSLAIKYRPSTLSEVKGNREIVTTLESMLSDKSTCPHSFLLTGQSGCGKTTIGRIIAARLGCVGVDFYEIDSADFRGIDSARDIRKNAQYMPRDGECIVFLIDECHKLTNDAQNALLKILEDTPSHVYFILCTTDPQKLLSTIKGRCSTFQVKPLTETQMYGLLRKVVKEEGKELPKLVLDQIVQDSLGQSRNALQTLEQVLHASPEQQLEIAKRAAEQQSEVIELCRALLSKKGWKEVSGILIRLKEAKEEDAEGIRRSVLGYCQAILLKAENNLAAAVLEAFLEPTYNTGFPGIVFSCYSAVKGV